MSKLKQHNYFLFELWVTLRAFPFGLTTLAVTMLVQDKLCLQTYHQSVAICQSLSKTGDSLTDESTRNSILSDSAKFSEYQNLIQCIPMVIWSLFSGSFLDKFNGGTKLLLVLGILGDFVSISLQLANVYFFNWGKLKQFLSWCIKKDLTLVTNRPLLRFASLLDLLVHWRYGEFLHSRLSVHRDHNY